jgi:hypothetical protein
LLGLLKYDSNRSDTSAMWIASASRVRRDI